MNREEFVDAFIDSLSPRAPISIRVPLSWAQSAKEDMLALDFETAWDYDGVPDPTDRTFRVVSASVASSYGVYFFQLTDFPKREGLQECIQNPFVSAVYMHNAYYDLMCLDWLTIPRPRVWRDTMLIAAQQGLGVPRSKNKSNVERYGLKPLVKNLYDWELQDFKAIAGKKLPREKREQVRNYLLRACQDQVCLLEPCFQKRLRKYAKTLLCARDWVDASSEDMPYDRLRDYNNLDAYWTLRLATDIDK